MNNSYKSDTDVILIGAGIMSATLGVLLKLLHPEIEIKIIERLTEVAAESTDAWNNAGTGHSAFCELNYTPETEDGSVDPTKAIKIAELFEISKEFWSYLVEKGIAGEPETFINAVPHMSFVWGKENVEFLRKRYEVLSAHPLFKDMLFSDDDEQLKEWMPLVMSGRDYDARAATRMEIGTDVNFGALTRCMFKYLSSLPNVEMFLGYEVTHLDRNKKNGWEVTFKNEESNEEKMFISSFVFIGAGGGSLPLLEKSGIEEAKGYGGFPISGQWLVCNNQEIIEKHSAKVYGLADVGAPPMSVPHLDTRIINGKKALLFGPYAGFTTKFLKHGSPLDLPKSIKLTNIIPMMSAGIKNLPLTKYLIDQVRLTPEGRLEALKPFIPTARLEDWDLEIAGQRVQVIKKDEEGGGVLEFGTEVVTSADGSISALLGASPGASVSVAVMLDIIQKCFPKEFSSKEWQGKIKEMIPSYGRSLDKDPVLCEEIRKKSSSVLKL
ncbi:MAG: malate/quinone oxidoreductase [Bacteroidota bacterium]|jgi:malate dehydrogenase (quinone)|nr:malate/quinone oxidoreductase [Bacteroidota bacterium]